MSQGDSAPTPGSMDADRHTGSATVFLQHALDAFNTKQYGRAEVILRQVTEQLPEHAAAWNLRGVNAEAAGDLVLATRYFINAVECDTQNARYCAALAAHLGRRELGHAAVEPWQRAIDLAPENADYHSAFADCLAAQKRRLDALPHYETAARLRPDDAAVAFRLGYALHQAGQLAEAADAYRDVLARAPEMHEARLNLSGCLRELGDSEGSIEQCRTVLQDQPDSVGALNNLGSTLCAIGRNTDAIAAFETALRHDPDNLTAMHNLGIALHAENAVSNAESYFRKCLEIRPNWHEAERSLANLLRSNGRLEEAAQLYQSVIDSRPLDFKSYGNLGLALLNLNKPHEAISVYEKAIALQPESPDLRIGLGIAQLVTGEFKNGWANYEARLQLGKGPTWRPGHDMPQWQGETKSPAGEPRATVLVHAEQGFGDTIQFCRYIPIISALGVKVIFECQTPLTPVMETLALLSNTDAFPLLTPADPIPDADYHVPLLSLPGIFKSDAVSLPAKVPYLAAPSVKKTAWADFPLGEKPAVGLVWGGNPNRQDDRLRSCPVEALAPIVATPGVQFVSLQKDSKQRAIPGVIDLGTQLSDFGDTAAIADRLDLIVSVDTAVAHLAGALGRPVWVMLGHAADWRYLLDRDDSPWYPTMRLFRQSQSGDWRSVTERIADELRGIF